MERVTVRGLRSAAICVAFVHLLANLMANLYEGHVHWLAQVGALVVEVALASVWLDLTLTRRCQREQAAEIAESLRPVVRSAVAQVHQDLDRQKEVEKFAEHNGVVRAFRTDRDRDD